MTRRARALARPASVLALVAVGAVVVRLGDPTGPGGFPLPPCPSKALTGLCCAGCGGMRMVYSLMSGDVGAAVRYNAVSLVVLVLLGWALVAWFTAAWRGRPVRTWLDGRWTPAVALVVYVVWTVVRNLPFPPFDRLYV